MVCYACWMAEAIHTIPLDDLIVHVTDGEDCPCGPEVRPVECDDGHINWQIVHHALDGREHSEPDHDRANCPLCADEIDPNHS